MVPSLPLLSCESSVSVKENPDRKKEREKGALDKKRLEKKFKGIMTLKQSMIVYDEIFRLRVIKLESYVGIARSSHQRCSIELVVLKIFTKFTGKHLRQSLFFSKVLGLRPETLFKRDSGTGVFL